MFACFALLLDDEAHNLIRKILHKVLSEGKYGIESALLPQHISLKQSFYISDIQEVEDYFDRFVKEISSFEITFNKVDLINIGSKGNESQVLWVDIEDNMHLSNIHNKLNSELLSQYSVPMSGFDGPEFHFHSTLTYGYNQYQELEKVKNEINSSFNNIKFNVNKAVLLYSLDDQVRAGRFMTYKILAMQGRRK
jgi:2'-5' RNA ligase